MSNNENKNMAAAKATDYDKDGIVSDREIELEIKLDKATAQSNLAIMAMVGLLGLMAYLVSPWAPTIALITALDSAISTFYLAMASIIGAYMGFTAWMTKGK